MMKAVKRDEREMKDSGIEWIGKIPRSWACCKQKNKRPVIQYNDVWLILSLDT